MYKDYSVENSSHGGCFVLAFDIVVFKLWSVGDTIFVFATTRNSHFCRG